MTDIELLSWVKRSEQRQNILRFLNKPRTPTEVSKEVDAHIAQVSHSLSEMSDRELIEVLNPDAKTGRLYQLTDKGEEILDSID